MLSPWLIPGLAKASSEVKPVATVLGLQFSTSAEVPLLLPDERHWRFPP